jgi:putative solute:sodium symporter small subunit
LAHKLHPDPTERETAYWRRNVRLVLTLLAVWFAVSYGAGILLAEWLNQYRLPGTGFPLGFWFAQQGSIYVFVILIFIYVWRTNRLDREFDVDEGNEAGSSPGGHA